MEPEELSWKMHFDDRALKEIEFDRIYARDFAHGTDGHNARLIIAKLVEIVETQQAEYNRLYLKMQARLNNPHWTEG